MTGKQAEQDFRAALHEVESNLDVRRLMIVVINVLVPGCTMATVSALAGSDLPAPLAWMPNHVLWIIGVVLAVGGLWTSAILGRCHFGLVVNGTKMQKAQSGQLTLRGLNWLGVTTNFLLITALTGGTGLAVALAVLGMPWLGVALGPVLVVAQLSWFRLQHARANRLCRVLDPHWQSGEIPAELRELHARKSLDATSADIAVVVTMGAALFAGTFDAACNMTGVAAGAVPGIDLADLKVTGVAGLMTFTLVSLLLTSRIVVRLRIALAQHAERLATLRGEADQPWRFRIGERTFLLYLLVALLAATAALIASWTWFSGLVGGVVCLAVFALHVVWYPVRLASARRRR